VTRARLCANFSLSVLDLGPMYATDRQTSEKSDVRRASSLNAPYPRGGDITMKGNEMGRKEGVANGNPSPRLGIPANEGDPSEKFDPSRPVSQGHRNQHGSIGLLWLSVNVPYQSIGLSRIVSEINSDFSLKSQNVPPPCI